jgi:Asp-tRNA(Asn)/Glu-tRNA(Gln) amidotransferase C subunit
LTIKIDGSSSYAGRPTIDYKNRWVIQQGWKYLLAYRYTGRINIMRKMVIVIGLIALMGCSSAYYGTMEKLGYPKRDLLVSRIESARDAQEEAKEEFESALEKFSSVLQFDGGKLEDKYNQLKSAYDRSNARAETVRERIDSVEDVAEALFAEWEEDPAPVCVAAVPVS